MIRRTSWISGWRPIVGLLSIVMGITLGLPLLLRADSTFETTLRDGRKVTLLKVEGRGFIWYQDPNDYSLLRVKEQFEYAKLDPVTGHLIPSGLVYGEVDPAQAGIVPGLRFSSRHVRSVRGDNEPSGPKPQEPLGLFNVLVIPIRFADHAQKPLPDPAVYNRIFNKNGGDPEYAEFGSVRDYLREVSYNQFGTSAYVLPWIQLPKPESYYTSTETSKHVTGWRIDEAAHYALDIVDSDPQFKELKLKEVFDRNNDGYLDAVAFLHSGYGAEAGGPLAEQRLRSMQYQLPDWTSRTGIKVRHIAVASGLYGTSGALPCRVSLLCHEGAHFAGLPDLYDESRFRRNGSGLGFWSLMGYHWGVDQTGKLPLHLSAWEKTQLGWVKPTVICDSGEYSIRAVEKHPDIFKIEKGFPPGEYLLIENRQPLGFDRQIPAGKDGQRGGLAIWHVDDRKHHNNDQGFPGLPGYPFNNAHYRVALLQADGQYHLEQSSENRGDGDDLFRASHKSSLTPDTVPNTKSYQLGVLRDSGVSILDISESGETMTFRVEFGEPKHEPETMKPLSEKPTSVADIDAGNKQQALTHSTPQRRYSVKSEQTDSKLISEDATILELPIEVPGESVLGVTANARVKLQSDDQVVEVGISTKETAADLQPASRRIASGDLNDELSVSSKAILKLSAGKHTVRLKLLVPSGQVELLPGAVIQAQTYSHK